MKKSYLILLFLSLSWWSKADEGMWIPSLIGKNYDEMVRLGLKLTAADLYDINHSSLKDAIVQFGGGCTAEMVSSKGLLITNHHCGYDAIASLSTVEKNYLDNGFWAHSPAEELPAPGITVIYLQNITDVTTEVQKAIGKASGAELNQKLEAIKKTIEERSAEKGKYFTTLKEYFNGNQYLLLVYKKYTDVRLVGTPPKSLGKFGGDTDNWMWPRHTADFSLFRVYANKANEPAAYAADNVPYQPKKYLPISLKGVQEGDFTMIFGYPARTNRYEVAQGVDMAINTVNPAIVKIRTARLALLQKHMNEDKAVYLKLTSSYSSIANYWKYYIGQTEQLKRLKVVENKKLKEKEFNKWAYKNKNYKTLLNDYNSLFATYLPYAKHVTYYNECFKACGLAKMGAALEPLEQYLLKGTNQPDSIAKYITALKAARTTQLKTFDTPTEKDLLSFSAQMFYNEVPKLQLPDIYEKVIFKNFQTDNQTNSFNHYTDYVFNHTFLIQDASFDDFCKAPSLDKINKDAAAQYALSFVHNFNTYYQPKLDNYLNNKKAFGKQYLKALLEKNTNQNLYPDANSTMRITYGKVKSYNPQDGVHYNYFTTLDGLMDKYQPQNPEFEVPKALIALYNKGDYGQYMDKDSSLHTCFITTNDITGGNSGSPVIDAHGAYLGAAFDGNWEAMSGDISFDKKYKRTIVCDARYILFLIDKLGDAHNLIEEMELIK